MTSSPTPPDQLHLAECALRELPPVIGPSRTTLDRLAQLATETEVHPSRSTATSASRSRLRRVTAFLLTTGLVIAAVLGLMDTPRSSFAFEDVLAAVSQAGNVSYKTKYTDSDGSSIETRHFHKGAWSRTEHEDGSYSVTDDISGRMLLVDPVTSIAFLTHQEGVNQDPQSMRESIVQWLKHAETSGESIGEKAINGIPAVGFKASFGTVTMTLWADPVTKLPVQIESVIGPPSDPTPTVDYEFVFDAPLDDGLFSTVPPAGFELVENTMPAFDPALISLPAEEHAVRILRFYTGLFDGAFPERINGPELVSLIIDKAGSERIQDPDFKQELATLSTSMGVSWLFHTSLDRFGYDGTPRLNDPDRIVFWYLPKNADKFRVVYADLTIGDVSEDKLPKPAAN